MPNPKVYLFSKISLFPLIIGLVLCQLLMSMVSCTPPTDEQTQEASVEVIKVAQTDSHSLGESAPNFSLLDLKGNQVNFSDYSGKILVIHFATTWCPFCNAEAPHLEKLYHGYQEKGVEVLIIDVKESQELVQEKLQDRFHLSFPVLLDEDGSVAASYAPEGVLPNLSRDEVVLASNLIIDRQGKIQFYSLLDSKNFDAELIALRATLDELL